MQKQCNGPLHIDDELECHLAKQYIHSDAQLMMQTMDKTEYIDMDHKAKRASPTSCSSCAALTVIFRPPRGVPEQQHL